MRVVLSAEGKDVTLEAVKAYQRTQLARIDSETCLLELLPLPSPSTGKWLYGEHSTLPQLRTRMAYMEHYARQRALHINSIVEKHEPAVVVFYSVNWWYLHWWKIIAGSEFARITGIEERAYTAINGHTMFVITKHPAAKGISNDHFHAIGRYLHEHMG